MSDGRCDMRDSLQRLKTDMHIESVLVEGGANIVQSILEHQLAHQVLMTIKTSFLGGYRSMTTQLSKLVDLVDVVAEIIGGDIILHGYVSSEALDVVDQFDKINENDASNGKHCRNSKSNEYSSFHCEAEARNIVEEWKKYAYKSENVYKKLYPSPSPEIS